MGIKEDQIDKHFEAWMFQGTETWVGKNITEILDEIVKITGMHRADVIKDIELIPRKRWSKIEIIDTDSNTDRKIKLNTVIAEDTAVNGVKTPYIAATTEF